MQFTSMKILGGLALALMASSVVAAPTSAVTDISATPSATSPTVSGKVSDAAGTTGSFRYSEVSKKILREIKPILTCQRPRRTFKTTSHP